MKHILFWHVFCCHSKAQRQPNEFFPRRTSPFMLNKNFPLLKPLNFGEAAISPVLMPLAKHHIAAKSCNNLSHHNIYTTPNLLNTKSTMYIFKGAHLASTLVNFFRIQVDLPEKLLQSQFSASLYWISSNSPPYTVSALSIFSPNALQWAGRPCRYILICM